MGTSTITKKVEVSTILEIAGSVDNFLLVKQVADALLAVPGAVQAESRMTFAREDDGGEYVVRAIRRKA